MAILIDPRLDIYQDGDCWISLGVDPDALGPALYIHPDGEAKNDKQFINLMDDKYIDALISALQTLKQLTKGLP